MKTVIVTGSQGFIGSYICQDLLAKGYKVIGIDNFSKYGPISRPQDNHNNFTIIKWDLTQSFPIIDVPVDCLIACAAMIGGISYFHKYAYDLLATNERILANTFDWAISKKLQRIIVLSSSMVYESTTTWPSEEEDVLSIPPPRSTYGFQKLASEYFCKGAWEQHGLPYTIIRVFNCVGVGEDKVISEEKVTSGNIKLMMSHVLPDLINKVMLGQDPIEILGDGTQTRCLTNGKDIARGIRLAMESPNTLNKTYNISSPTETAIFHLADMVWSKFYPDKVFRCKFVPGYKYDVQKRIPAIDLAYQDFGFKAEISLEESVDEVIEHMAKVKC